uniref:Artemin n=1 Tax=Capra hircus TaxID=9925 RepID=A0A8C2R615_CAPHI
MEPGRGGPSVLPLRAGPRRQAPHRLFQPALWPTLAALALLSSVAEGEASLGPAPRSPVPREGPTPAPASPAGPLAGR